ncbi:MAG: DNA polymerase domain-containing protein, partial [Candidatus Omnitrophota bacterium]
MTDVYFRPYGVMHRGLGAVVFGRTVGDGASCAFVIGEVDRRAFVALAPGATTERIADALDALGLAGLRWKIPTSTDGTPEWNVAYGDMTLYGAVPTVKAFFSRRCPPLPAACTPGVFVRVLANGSADAVEEIAVGRQLRTHDRALAMGASMVPDASKTTRCTNEFAIERTKQLCAIDDPDRDGIVPFKIAFVKYRIGATIEVATAVATFRERDLDSPWIRPEISDVVTPEHGPIAILDAGAALRTAARFVDGGDPDMVVLDSSTELEELQRLVDSHCPAISGFPVDARNVCFLADWSATVGDSVLATVNTFFGENVLWRALCGARDSRTLLREALGADEPHLAEMALLTELRACKVLAPDTPPRQEAHGRRKRGKPKYKGGLVLDARCGMHSDVHILDFRQLYPSLVRERNIDVTNRTHAVAPDDPNPPHLILPTIMTRLMHARARLQASAADHADDVSQITLAAVLCKLVANAAYGVHGQPGSRFECIQIAEEITG